MTASAHGSDHELIVSLVSDLRSESSELLQVLEALSDDDWARPTPAAGWTVLDQVTHLAYFDDITRISIADPERFQVQAAELVAGGQDFPDRVAAQFHHTAPRDVIAWFDRSRTQLSQTFLEADPVTRLPWFGPAMSPASSVTARLMETWAHGQDVLDTMGITRTSTDRMRHVADLGVRALRYTYSVNELDVPTDPIRVELAVPDGQYWCWGPQDAHDRISGDALDFCLVVTQRRHRDDTSLDVHGVTATQWLKIAQTFAGPAGPGQQPGHVQNAVRAAASPGGL